MAKMTVEDLPLEGKKVLMRVDFNVPIKDGVVGDDNRIVAALPTINYVIDHGGRAILFSHLGRIKKEEDKPGLSLRPVAERLSNLLNKPVTFVPVTEGKQLEDAISQMNNGDVLLVQNTRYEDVKDGEYVKRESGNDPELGKYWASLGDVFVNDAFGTAHRAHASNVGIAQAIGAGKSGVGFLMEKEIKFLGDAVDNPVRPFVAILGGAKYLTRLALSTTCWTRPTRSSSVVGWPTRSTLPRALRLVTHWLKKTRSMLPSKLWTKPATSWFCQLTM